MRLAARSDCERQVIVDVDPYAGAMVVLDASLSCGALLSQTLRICRARRQRFETRVRHPGQGAEVRLDGAYVLRDRRHADLKSSVRHEGPGGRTGQLAPGVWHDQARALLQGQGVVPLTYFHTFTALESREV